MLNDILKVIFKGLKKFIVIIAICLFIFFVAQTAYNYGFNITNSKKNSQLIKNVTIEIPKGSTTKDIAKKLADNGLITSALMFRVNAKMEKLDGKFHYGTYDFNTDMTEAEIIDLLLTEGAKRKDIKITIPEGYAVQQIAKYLDEKKLCTEDEFLMAIDSLKYDYNFVSQIPKRPNRLQGYLFPDTYNIREGASAEEIVSTMLSQFDKVFTDTYKERANELGYTIDEVVIMASIIEREARVAEERPKMASVIYNRLEQNMPLGMCSTVLYALDKIGEPVKKLYTNETKVDSPYNTYINKGLPLGPIANPGKEAIDAVLYPDDTDFLYFYLVDEENGKHHFSKTYEEHLSVQGKN